MRKKIYALIPFILIAFISFPALAQDSPKIGVIDTEKAIRESIWGKKAIQELETEVEAWKQKGEKLDKEISVLEEELAKQRSFLEDKETEQKLEREIGDKRMEGQSLIQEGNARLTEKRQDLLKPILSEMEKIIKSLAVEESYDIILEKQITLDVYSIQLFLYLNPEYDITSRIVVMLDKAYRDRESSKVKKSEKPMPEETKEGEGSNSQ